MNETNLEIPYDFIIGGLLVMGFLFLTYKLVKWIFEIYKNK